MEKLGGLMRIQVVVICAVVGVLGLITVILGVAGTASAAQYGSTAAVGCGIAAALFALTGQIVVTAASGCYGCCRTWGIPTETKRIVALVLAAISWLLVIIDVVLFILGAAVAIVGDYIDGVFPAATVLSLVAVGFQITSYILLQLTAASTAKPLEEQQSGIAMGQPIQPEPQSADQQAAAGGDPPTPAPTSLKESRADPTSQV